MIAAACRDNSARIVTLQVAGKLFGTGGHHEGQWDPITGQTHNSQTREFLLRWEADCCRYDVTADREVSAEGEVNYHIPFGEHIMSHAKLERQGGMEALKRAHGTPRTTSRTILTPETAYEYRPESNELRMNMDSVQALRGLNQQGGVQLPLNRILAGSTVAEFIDRWANAPWLEERSAAVEPVGGGQFRVRLSAIRQRTDGMRELGVSDLVVDLDRGGNAVSYVFQVDGVTQESGMFDYVCLAGAWVASHGEVEVPSPPGIPPLRAIYEIAPESLRVNDPIDRREFAFESLGVRRGARVIDEKTHEEYLYDDVPIDVKIALAIEKEHAEEQAEAAARPAADPRPGMPEQPVQYAPPTRNEPALHSAHRPDAGAPLAGTAAPTPPAKETPAPEAPRGPSALKMITPRSRPAPQPAVAPQPPRPATRPGTTHVLTPDKAPGPEAAPARLAPPAPASPAKPATGSRISRTVLTTAVVSAGCVAAFAIALWKRAQRG